MWENYAKETDTIYDKILKRAKSQLPEHTRGDSRFEVPQPDSMVEGNRTFIRNFKDIAMALNREENHILKYLTTELGTNGNIEGSRAIFQGKHARVQIQKLLDRYTKDFVLCGECGKPDTRFVHQGRVLVMRCDACGATNAIRQ